MWKWTCYITVIYKNKLAGLQIVYGVKIIKAYLIMIQNRYKRIPVW
jgi:hypothetical protein